MKVEVKIEASNAQELAQVVDVLSGLAEGNFSISREELAKCIAKEEEVKEPVKEEPKKAAEPKAKKPSEPKAKEKAEEVKEEPKAAPKAAKADKEALRNLIGKLLQDDEDENGPKVKAILSDFGARNVSTLDAESYQEVYDLLKELENE